MRVKDRFELFRVKERALVLDCEVASDVGLHQSSPGTRLPWHSFGTILAENGTIKPLSAAFRPRTPADQTAAYSPLRVLSGLGAVPAHPQAESAGFGTLRGLLPP